MLYLSQNLLGLEQKRFDYLVPGIFQILEVFSYLHREPQRDNKYLSWMYSVDRKICHEGH